MKIICNTSPTPFQIGDILTAIFLVPPENCSDMTIPDFQRLTLLRHSKCHFHLTKDCRNSCRSDGIVYTFKEKARTEYCGGQEGGTWKWIKV